MATTNNKQPQAVFFKITSLLLKLANYGAHGDETLCALYFIVSMTTVNKKCPQTLFPITTSSLLKLANHAMHGAETWYACVFERFHDNHRQKLPQALFPVTTSSLLKLANHVMHGWCRCCYCMVGVDAPIEHPGLSLCKDAVTISLHV